MRNHSDKNVLRRLMVKPLSKVFGTFNSQTEMISDTGIVYRHILNRVSAATHAHRDRSRTHTNRITRRRHPRFSQVTTHMAGDVITRKNYVR